MSIPAAAFLILLAIDLLIVAALRRADLPRGLPFLAFFVPGALVGLLWVILDPIAPLASTTARMLVALTVGSLNALLFQRVLSLARRTG